MNDVHPAPGSSARITRATLGGILAITLLATAHGQEKPYTQPGTATPLPPTPPKPAGITTDAQAKPNPAPTPAEQSQVQSLFHGRIPEVLAKGKFNLNARLRYEWVDQSTFEEEANAPTLRTRFGYTTAPLHGFQGMLEGENITVIGPDENYNAAGSNKTGDRPIVQDPPTTELNQAWLSYTYTNWVTARGGRQRLVLDNHRSSVTRPGGRTSRPLTPRQSAVRLSPIWRFFTATFGK